MRQIVLDTETTGLNHDKGDRIVELGCVEIINRELTGNNLHLYFNPERDSAPEALQVHGLTTEFLSQYPPFEACAQQIIDYLQGAQLIIHNASFDIGFLNAELKKSKKASIDAFTSEVIDTLTTAREIFPGKANSLDALCNRLGVSNQHRTLHGALLDAELLANVWFAMTRGQFDLLGNLDNPSKQKETATPSSASGLNVPLATQAPSSHYDLPVIQADAKELAAHQDYVEVLDKAISGDSLWHRYSNEN